MNNSLNTPSSTGNPADLLAFSNSSNALISEWPANLLSI